MDFIFLLQHNTFIILYRNSIIELYTEDESPVVDIEISNSMFIYYSIFNDKTTILYLQQNTHTIYQESSNSYYMIRMRNMYHRDVYYIITHGLY
ncbi:hypothetical protein Cassandra_0256 [Pseudomonas phage Cassandra]|nr:hypothetical protein Cassandra_0256 [Pseudomonas phage Cassandra]